MIGTLGRISCRVASVSVPSFTSSPDTATVTEWDSIAYRGPSWITAGDGPYQAAVPVGGRYLVSFTATVGAANGAPTPTAVGAGFRAAGLDAVTLALYAPEFPVDDTEGTAYVSGSATAIVELAAGTPLELAIAAGNADASMSALGVFLLAIDLVRL